MRDLGEQKTEGLASFTLTYLADSIVRGTAPTTIILQHKLGNMQHHKLSFSTLRLVLAVLPWQDTGKRIPIQESRLHAGNRSRFAHAPPFW